MKKTFQAEALKLLNSETIRDALVGKFIKPLAADDAGERLGVSWLSDPACLSQNVRRFLASRVNESRTNQSDKPQHTWIRTVAVRLAWFALLFLMVAGLSLYAVGSSFPLPGGSDRRAGMPAFHESVGGVIMTVIHSPFSWLHDYVDGKTAGLLVWFCWAAGLFTLSALFRRPRWVFSIRRTQHEPGPV